MRKFYTWTGAISLSLFSFSLQAQNILTVNSGTDLFISAGTEFSAGGLTIVPSEGVTLNGTSIERAETATTFTYNTYAKPVYRFTAPTAPFSGTIRMQYSEAGLAGLAEATLKVNLSNGSRWLALSSAFNDVAGNVVISTPFSSEVLVEVALADAAYALPLVWGKVTVTRQGSTNRVAWTTYNETCVSHFDVERSSDGRNWMVILPSITARNTGSVQQYTGTDGQPLTGKQWYRIRQTDRDGRFSSSSITMVDREALSGVWFVYPNPVQEAFSLHAIGAGTFRQVVLYSGTGQPVKRWQQAASRYSLEGLAAGVYHLSITKTDGTTQQITINKQ